MDHLNFFNEETNSTPTHNTLTTEWIEQLALDELNMEETGIVNFNATMDPKSMLEESSIAYMDNLKDLFEFYVDKFNMYRGADAQSKIKIFKISNSINDFMLFRNSLKLIVSRTALDVITVRLTGGNAGFAQTQSKKVDIAGHEIRAHVGAFNEITWRYNADLVNPSVMVRHYLTEFIQNSSN